MWRNNYKLYYEFSRKKKNLGTMKGDIRVEERRKSKRLDLESTLVMKRLDGTGEENVRINVIDVSKRGIGFTCEKPLQIGAVYESHLTIWTKEVISAFVEIVRIEKAEDTFIYGGIFIGMPELDSCRIAIYDVVHTYVDGCEE